MSISLENMIDRQVFFVLRDIKTLASTGLDHEQLVATLRGYEKRLGLWIEVESIKNCPVKSEGMSLDGTPAIIFIPFYHIVTMIFFPEMEKIEIDIQRERKIGFRQE